MKYIAALNNFSKNVIIGYVLMYFIACARVHRIN